MGLQTGMFTESDLWCFEHVNACVQRVDLVLQVLDQGVERDVNLLIVDEDQYADFVWVRDLGNCLRGEVLVHVLMTQRTTPLRGRVSVSPVAPVVNVCV